MISMTITRKTAIAAVTVVALAAAGGTTFAIAGGGGDDDATDRAITGQALDRASAAALKSTGGGSVTETEVGDEEGAYEVEVKKPDGSSVDVHLDKQFNVLSRVTDTESEDEGAE